MSTSTFIDQLAAGHAADAKETLSNLLSARAFEALDVRKQELGATLFGGQVEEEVEELEEISRDTVKNYVNKAQNQIDDRRNKYDELGYGTQDYERTPKEVNRIKNIKKGQNRLDKEYTK
jgi:hypothetical protein